VSGLFSYSRFVLGFGSLATSFLSSSLKCVMRNQSKGKYKLSTHTSSPPPTMAPCTLGFGNVSDNKSIADSRFDVSPHNLISSAVGNLFKVTNAMSVSPVRFVFLFNLGTL